ncbi:hypothetical protein [Corynebacterium caspium]|uniref:hypothetical protein n=1 Tax=Corynebacterium caspium TaxID=234828 RepID=UPI00035C113F|nr:hypothetical protein [Corynebacterium caspium]WKD59883.1 hypothetical protein CCASP_07540 [Corynebacterium caspium DSM 44850]
MLILKSLLEVLITGLILGAGMPMLFALGIRWTTPSGPEHAKPGEDPGRAHFTNKPLGILCFTIIAAAIIIGILWITKDTIYHYFAWDIFGTEVK